MLLPDINQFPLIKSIVKREQNNEPSESLSGTIADLQKSLPDMSLSKSLDFTKTGTEIKAGIMIKIAQCEAELTNLINDWKKSSATSTGTESEITPVKSTEEPEPELGEPWKVRSKRRQIDRLYRIHRNLADKKVYKLSEYDLQEYGL